MAQQIRTILETFIPKVRSSPIVANIERILQPTTDFIRGNPIVSTAAIGIGVTGLTAGIAAVRKRRAKPRKKAKRKKKRKARRRIQPRRKRPKKKTKAELRAFRCRCLAKARRTRKKKHIIRGPGLGRDEIRHSGKSTKGKHKVVSFRDKRTGKMVRFKARR